MIRHRPSIACAQTGPLRGPPPRSASTPSCRSDLASTVSMVPCENPAATARTSLLTWLRNRGSPSRPGVAIASSSGPAPRRPSTRLIRIRPGHPCRPRSPEATASRRVAERLSDCAQAGKTTACGVVSLRRYCPDQVPGGRRSASELSPASPPGSGSPRRSVRSSSLDHLADDIHVAWRPVTSAETPLRPGRRRSAGRTATIPGATPRVSMPPAPGLAPAGKVG